MHMIHCNDIQVANFKKKVIQFMTRLFIYKNKIRTLTMIFLRFIARQPGHILVQLHLATRLYSLNGFLACYFHC